jgi:hypothetical protein
MTPLAEIKAALEKIPKWQRSYFVDHPRYNGASELWKASCRELERMTIRGEGVVGTPECNILFTVTARGGTQPSEDIMEVIGHAPQWLSDLVQRVEELDAELQWIIDKLKTMKTYHPPTDERERRNEIRGWLHVLCANRTVLQELLPEFDRRGRRVEELEARLAKHTHVPVPPASLPEKLSVEIPDDWDSEGD